MSEVIADLSDSRPVLVGFKKCGCCVAVDLDSQPETMVEYTKHGYKIKMMPQQSAIALLKASRCIHKE